MAKVQLKTVLITGCSEGGIGFALANEFHKAGFHVFATARNKLKMTSLGDKENMTLLTLDVVKSEDIAAAAEQVTSSTEGKLDLLINNAARNHFMPLADENIQDVRELFESNVIGPLAMITAFIPLLVAAQGCIVNVSSLSGQMNIPLLGSFAATKSSLDVLSETLRLELKPFNVSVITLMTGAVQSNGLSYMTGFKLPPGSLYKSIEKEIHSFANGCKRPKNLPSAEMFATEIVPSLINLRTNGILYMPDLTTTALRFANRWLPTRLMDRLWMSVSSMNEVRISVQKKEA